MLTAVLTLLLSATPDPLAVNFVRRATREYNSAAFAPAYLNYQAAYEIEPIPELLFDMAQAQRGLHHWDRALFLYRRYLTLRPNSSARLKVERLIVQTEERLRQEPRPTEEAVALVPPAAAAPNLDGVPVATPDLRVAPLAAQGSDSTDGRGSPNPSQGPGGRSTPEIAAVPRVSVAAEASASKGPDTPTGAWILGSVGAVGLLGGGGLGVAVLLQPDRVTGLPPLHSLTYPQIQTVRTEGSVGVALAVGGALLLGSGILWGLVSQ